MTYDVAAYIWPAYTGREPRSYTFWPEGIGEWQSVRTAVKKTPEHDWPRRPLWGFVDEADPYVMEMEIEAAVDHGVNVFIYDWYWYDRRPYLEQCLNDGFLQAKNRHKMKFYLMWANHDANNTWDIRNSHHETDVIWGGAVDRKEFEKIAKRLMTRYFTDPSYYTIDGKPVFMIYDIANLVDGLGGIEETQDALQWFREECKRHGLPGLHLQMTLWSEHSINLSGVDQHFDSSSHEMIRLLNFDSVTHYQFVHFVDIDRPYHAIMEDVQAEWQRIDETYDVPYFPHISVGWDNNPRFKGFRPGIMKENTPDAIKRALYRAKDFVDQHPDRPPLVTINSWNEWTETSYLQPDDRNGYGYLEAVRDVFVEQGTDHAPTENEVPS